MHLRRVVAIALALAAAGLSALAQAPPTRAAHTVPVTVSIISVDGVGDDLDGIGRGDGDFYAGAAFSGGSRLDRKSVV
jgi:hypothetical protein